jgi:hypothetical protein
MGANVTTLHLTPKFYQITVEGKIDATWSEWLGGMRTESHKDANGAIITTLSGLLSDQAALRGILNRIWDLNLVLRSVQQFDPNHFTIKG